jgi:phenylacetic acid degradation operon negative regulatory protein
VPESSRQPATTARPGPVRGPSARAYLLIVLGEYALVRGGAAWTQTVLDALALAGFEAKAGRQALTRTAAEGLIESDRAGRRTRWHLTPAGHEFLLAAKHRLFATGPETDWNGDWLILLTSVPENHRNLRHRLRSSMSWAGFGSPSPGVWLSPHPTRAAEARRVLDSLGEPVRATLLHARLDDPAERHRLVGQAWDVDALASNYNAFVDHFATIRPSSPGETLGQLAHLVYQWRRLLLADPGLPPTLLPPAWSGERARELLLDLHQRWYEAACAWWRDRETEHDRD